MKKNKITIIVSVVILLVIGLSLAYYYSFVAPKKAIAERCANYVPYWTDFVECYGVVVINDGWDMDYLSIRDHVHEYEIARIYNLNQLVHTEEKIYVINRKIIEGQTSDGIKIEYYQKLFQNDEVVKKYYDSISDIPTYLVIDYKSGEVSAYKNITDVPENDRGYFEQLKN